MVIKYMYVTLKINSVTSMQYIIHGCNFLWSSHATIFIHWGRVMHICIGNLTIIGSDNGLAPTRRQATIWINAGIFLIGPLGKNSSGILIEILTFSFTKMCLKVSSVKWHPFCLGLNVLTHKLRDDFCSKWFFNLIYIRNTNNHFSQLFKC